MSYDQFQKANSSSNAGPVAQTEKYTTPTGTPTTKSKGNRILGYRPVPELSGHALVSEDYGERYT
jgi:hypothetical protein